MMMRNVVAVALLVGSALSNPLQPYQASSPSGKYHGDKTVLGESVDCTVEFSSATELAFQISGAISLDCQEPYTFGSDEVKLNNINNPDDCVAKALSSNHATLESIDYNEGADQLTVKVKVTFITVSFLLSKVSSETTLHALPQASIPFTELLSRHFHVFASQRPLGSYEGVIAPHANNLQVSAQVSARDRMDISVGGHTCKGIPIPRVAGRLGIAATTSDELGSSAEVKDMLRLTTMEYEPMSDSLVLEAFVDGHSSLVELSPPQTMTAAEEDAAPMVRLYNRYYKAYSQAAPAGDYAGSKTVLGQTVNAKVSVKDGSTCEIQISGPISLDCKSEAYTFDGSNINLPNDTKQGDCVHDAMSANHVELEGIAYDATANHVTFKVKYLFMTISVELDPVSA